MANWRTQHAPEVLLPALRRWFQTPVGRAVLQEERPLIANIISDASTAKYNLLNLSMVPELCPIDNGVYHRQFCLGGIGHYGLSQVLDVVCDFEELPVANESQDVVVLHHLLEFVENPHKVLREVERVIVPYGKVVVCGINPYSLLAVRGIMGQLKQSPMWQNHRLSIHRISDWLSLLGFEVSAVEYAFHRLPINSPDFFMRHRSAPKKWPMGGVFVLSATKYRAPLIPSIEKLQRRAQILRHPSMVGATRSTKTRANYERSP
ncbi:MAG: SAM-dependent methyltransferase [Zhongshania sp.]|jgi:SAM-dependent methyltransferase